LTRICNKKIALWLGDSVLKKRRIANPLVPGGGGPYAMISATGCPIKSTSGISLLKLKDLSASDILLAKEISDSAL